MGNAACPPQARDPASSLQMPEDWRPTHSGLFVPTAYRAVVPDGTRAVSFQGGPGGSPLPLVMWGPGGPSWGGAVPARPLPSGQSNRVGFLHSLLWGWGKGLIANGGWLSPLGAPALLTHTAHTPPPRPSTTVHTSGGPSEGSPQTGTEPALLQAVALITTSYKLPAGLSSNGRRTS